MRGFCNDGPNPDFCVGSTTATITIVIPIAHTTSGKGQSGQFVDMKRISKKGKGKKEKRQPGPKSFDPALLTKHWTKMGKGFRI